MAELKASGNILFQRGEFEGAIKTYSQALSKFTPDGSNGDELQLNLLLNRARCYLKLNDFKQVESDARIALNINEDDFGALYLLGKALVKQNNFTDGIKKLRRAESIASARNQPHLELQAKNARLDGLRIQWEHEAQAEEAKDLEIWHKIKSKVDLSEDELLHLKQIMRRKHDENKQRIIPEYMMCKITMVLMRDPVVSPCSGITYERSALLLHLRRNGNVDPVTREVCEPGKLVPNLALKAAIEEFLTKNPWAVKEWLD